MRQKQVRVCFFCARLVLSLSLPCSLSLSLSLSLSQTLLLPDNDVHFLASVSKTGNALASTYNGISVQEHKLGALQDEMGQIRNDKRLAHTLADIQSTLANLVQSSKAAKTANEDKSHDIEEDGEEGEGREQAKPRSTRKSRRPRSRDKNAVQNAIARRSAVRATQKRAALKAESNKKRRKIKEESKRVDALRMNVAAVEADSSMMYDRLEDHQISSSRVQQSVEYGLNSLKDFISQAARERNPAAAADVGSHNGDGDEDGDDDIDIDDDDNDDDDVDADDAEDDEQDSVMRGDVRPLELGGRETKDDDDDEDDNGGNQGGRRGVAKRTDFLSMLRAANDGHRDNGQKQQGQDRGQKDHGHGQQDQSIQVEIQVPQAIVLRSQVSTQTAFKATISARKDKDTQTSTEAQLPQPVTIDSTRSTTSGTQTESIGPHNLLDACMETAQALSSANEDIAECEEQAARVDTFVMQAQDDLEKVERDLDAKLEQRDVLEDDLSALQDHLEMSKKAVAASLLEHEELKSEILKAIAERNNIVTGSEKMRAQSVEVETTVSKRTAEAKRLESKCRGLEDEIEKGQASAKKAREMQATVEEAAARARGEMAQIVERRAKEENRLAELRVHIVEYSDHVKAAKGGFSSPCGRWAIGGGGGGTATLYASIEFALCSIPRLSTSQQPLQTWHPTSSSDQSKKSRHPRPKRTSSPPHWLPSSVGARRKAPRSSLSKCRAKTCSARCTD